MKRTCLAVLVVCLGAAGVQADWDEMDGHKMHFPQLPDPDGWDVDFWSQNAEGTVYTAFLADDWFCSDTGPVMDIHFWVSMKGDTLEANPSGTVPFHITSLRALICENIPAGVEYKGQTYTYSTPGDTLWEAYYGGPDYHTVSVWSQQPQGYFDPVSQESIASDHDWTYQVNIPDTSTTSDGPKDPFDQQAGTVYWLTLVVDAVRLDANGDPIPNDWVDLGWKTADVDAYPEGDAGAPFMDVATYRYVDDTTQPTINVHRELVIEGVSQDLAFVITPEPATLALLALGGLGVLLSRRRA